MYSISFKSNPTKPITTVLKKSEQPIKKLSVEEAKTELNIRFGNYVKTMKEQHGKKLEAMPLIKTFNSFCEELGLRAAECYKIFANNTK